jgi:hypothetical protein
MHAAIGKERIKNFIGTGYFFLLCGYMQTKKYPQHARNYNKDLGIITYSNHVPLINHRVHQFEE